MAYMDLSAYCQSHYWVVPTFIVNDPDNGLHRNGMKIDYKHAEWKVIPTGQISDGH